MMTETQFEQDEEKRARWAEAATRAQNAVRRSVRSVVSELREAQTGYEVAFRRHAEADEHECDLGSDGIEKAINALVEEFGE